MNALRVALFLAACCTLLGCSSQPSGPPATLTDSQKAAIAAEDAKVQAEESQRK